MNMNNELKLVLKQPTVAAVAVLPPAAAATASMTKRTGGAL